MRAELNQGLIDFLEASPTPFHATASLARRLKPPATAASTSATPGTPKPAAATT